MPASPPSLTTANRARGALLGFAAGNVLGVPTEFMYTAEAIHRVYPDGVRDVARQDRTNSPYAEDLALALILASGLDAPEPDFEGVAREWIAWRHRDGRGMGSWTRYALTVLEEQGAPLTTTGGQAGNGAVARCLPVAIAAWNAPRNLIGATLAQAALTHPDPRCLWSAVAVNVACARLLAGHRDFIPDVLEALRGNDAPAEVSAAVNRVPLLLTREELPVTGMEAGYTVHCMQIALWFAHHEPNLERGLVWLASAGGDTDTNAAVAGGLMGARDGVEAIPARWIDCIPDHQRIGDLAERLAARTAAP